MADFPFGLAFLSTAFMISHLMSDLDRYLLLTQKLQARYIFSDPDNIPLHEKISDYQAFRTLRIHIGTIMIIVFGLFSIGIISLWSWMWSYFPSGGYQDVFFFFVSSETLFFPLILLFLQIFVLLFQVSEFIECTGHEGIAKVLYFLSKRKVYGKNTIFRNYVRDEIIKNGALTKEELEIKLEMNFNARVMFWISRNLAEEISFAIIIFQFPIMYFYLSLIPEIKLYNELFFIIFLILTILVYLSYIYKINIFNNRKRSIF